MKRTINLHDMDSVWGKDIMFTDGSCAYVRGYSVHKGYLLLSFKYSEHDSGVYDLETGKSNDPNMPDIDLEYDYSQDD